MPLVKVQLNDVPLSLMQDSIADNIQALQGSPLAGAQLLKDVVLASGQNNVGHGLGRPPLGWFVARLRASATIYDLQDTNPNPDRTLWLTSSAPVTVDLVVF